MDNLWAPWRRAYITGEEKSSGCIFCEKPEDTDDDAHLILHRGEHCFIIMNLYPYNNGHLMVVPYRHTGDLTELSPEEIAEMMRFSQMMIAIIRRTMNAAGFNVGLNLGSAAGAGIAEHLHLHVVPRWFGDTNFMPAIGEVKVISEHIRATYDRLKAAIAEEIA